MSALALSAPPLHAALPQETVPPGLQAVKLSHDYKIEQKLDFVKSNFMLFNIFRLKKNTVKKTPSHFENEAFLLCFMLLYLCASPYTA